MNKPTPTEQTAKSLFKDQGSSTRKEKQAWLEASNDTALPWTAELIELHKEKWSWSGLSANPNLPWTQDLLEQFKEYWHWHILSFNPELPWTAELIEQYKTRWNMQALYENKAIHQQNLSSLKVTGC